MSVGELFTQSIITLVRRHCISLNWYNTTILTTVATLIRIVGPCYISNNPILSKFKKSHLCRPPSNRIHIFYTNFIKNPVFIFSSSSRPHQDGRSQSGTSWRSSWTKGKCWLREIFDKQTNKQTNRTNKEATKAKGVKACNATWSETTNIGINNISFKWVAQIFEVRSALLEYLQLNPPVRSSSAPKVSR